jgi:Truncated, possibly inactive, lysyl-tRNA synthetase (class II)
MSETASWQPSAPIANLLKRAAILAEIRRFFADRGVLEVRYPGDEPGDHYRISIWYPSRRVLLGLAQQKGAISG